MPWKPTSRPTAAPAASDRLTNVNNQGAEGNLGPFFCAVIPDGPKGRSGTRS